MLESPDMPPGKPDQEKIYLATNSPRRRELMSLGGWEYALLSPQVDETPLPGEDGVAYVCRLAKSKVLAAAGLGELQGVIIAADTSVIDEGVGENNPILGKPRHPQEALEMLLRLRNHTHQVHTALAIRSGVDGTLISDLCTTPVPMRDYTTEEIEIYVASGDPMDKAGAYAIQHAGFHPAEQLDGCYANVMGLPLCHLTRSLRKLGIHPPADVPAACQAVLGYHCPVYPQVLSQENWDYTCEHDPSHKQ